MKAAIRGVGVLAPGLDGWRNARAVLAGLVPFAPGPVALPAPTGLSTTERRRINATSHWAMTVAADATASMSADETGALAAVFGSGDGDGDVLDQTLRVLADPAGDLSPTLFHNSVFNAPGGYWSISTHAGGPSTTLCAGDATFALALVEAITQVDVHGLPVLCVCVDLGYPASLAALRPAAQSFACGLVLADPADGHGATRLGTIEIRNGVGPGSPPAPDALEVRFEGNPSARAIPLLAAIARGATTAVRIREADGRCLDVGYYAA